MLVIRVSSDREPEYRVVEESPKVEAFRLGYQLHLKVLR